VLVLSFTKSRRVSSAEAQAARLRRRVDKLAAQEVTLAKRLDVAKTEFAADAQLFSFRTFQNESRRNQFLEYVRAELER
jgi:hypothetical protein